MKQTEMIRAFLNWMDTCPFDCQVTSMQGSTVLFVKFFLVARFNEQDKEKEETNE